VGGGPWTDRPDLAEAFFDGCEHQRTPRLAAGSRARGPEGVRLRLASRVRIMAPGRGAAPPARWFAKSPTGSGSGPRVWTSWVGLVTAVVTDSR